MPLINGGFMHHALDIRTAFIGLALALAAGVMLAPPMPFIIDGGIYLDMARAMTEDGALATAGDGGVEDAPALTKYLTRTDGALVYPQYPSGYALISAPFYALLGVRGLMLMNALALLGSIWLTYFAAKRLLNDENTGLVAAGILLLGTFVSNYAFAIWPHMMSLVVWLSAVTAAIIGNDQSRNGRRALWFAASGLIIGLGVNIRIDSVLLFGVLFAWLRLFARPADRIAPLWLLIGATPALLLAAWLNQLKFGVFPPVTYGSSAGATDIRGYLPIVAAGCTALAAIWVINAPAVLANAHRRFGTQRLVIAGAIGGLAAMTLMHEYAWRIVYGAYVLVINLQAHNAYFQAGVEANEFGQLMFWGYPKKALIQSLPFLPLIIIPAFAMTRGRYVAATSLCLFAIAAPVAFYSINQWHGGGSYNMRYFIPALPFISILSAVALREIKKTAGSVERRDFLIVGVGAAVLYLGAQELGSAVPALYAPAALYPQWVLALLCAALIAAFLLRKDAKTARAALLASAEVLAYSAFLSLENEASHEKARGELFVHSKEIAKSIPPDALVLTQLPVLLTHAEASGAAVMVPRESNIEQSLRAAAAFEHAGRCVYFHNSIVSDLLAPHMPARALHPEPAWAGREVFPDDPRFAFFVLSSQVERCAF